MVCPYLSEMVQCSTSSVVLSCILRSILLILIIITTDQFYDVNHFIPNVVIFALYNCNFGIKLYNCKLYMEGITDGTTKYRLKHFEEKFEVAFSSIQTSRKEKMSNPFYKQAITFQFYSDIPEKGSCRTHSTKSGITFILLSFYK